MYSRPLRSVSRPNLETSEPFGMTEVDLRTESSRLEKMLADGQLPGDQVKRLEQIRKCMDRFAALKAGKAIPSRPLLSRRSIECKGGIVTRIIK